MSHYKHLTTKERCCIVHFKKLDWSIIEPANELGRLYSIGGDNYYN